MTRTSQCSMQVIHIDLNFSQSYQCQCTRNKTLCITYYLLEIFVRYGKRKMKQRLRWAHFYRDRSAHWTNHNTDFFTVALENGNFFFCIFRFKIMMKTGSTFWNSIRFDGWLIDLGYYTDFRITIFTFMDTKRLHLGLKWQYTKKQFD